MHKNNICFSILVYWIVLTSNVEVNGQESRAQKPQKGCSGYGFQIWLSCLTDPCLFATCPRFHGIATCKKEISGDCKTCRAAFYVNDRRVNCQPTNFECPPGLPLQQCTNDPCTITECMDDRFKNAECRGYYCGGCLAEYYVDGTWQQCPNPDVKLQGDAALLLPEIRQAMNEFQGNSDRSPSSGSLINTCPDGTPEPQCPTDVCTRTECPQYSRATCVVNKCQGCKPEFYLRGQLVNCQSKCRRNVLEMKCSDDPCKYATCPLYPAAECRPSNCGYCHPEWYVNNKVVNCFSRMPDNYQCPNGLQQQQCPRNTCRFNRCLKNAQTFCRINNCGGCYAEYVNTKGEIVDCVGWWTKYENKKPKELLEVSSAAVVPTAGATQANTADVIQLTGTSGSSQAAGTTLTQSGESKEQLLDNIFAQFGFDNPTNTNTAPRSVTSNDNILALKNQKITNIEPNTANTIPSTNSWGTIVNDQDIGKLKETKRVIIRANNGQDRPRTEPDRPVQLVIHREPIKNVQIRPSRSQNIWSEPNSDLVGGGQQKQVINQPPTKPISINNRPSPAMNQPPRDPFKPVSISLDSLNNNKNFVPGVPIHGFPWRQNFQ